FLASDTFFEFTQSKDGTMMEGALPALDEPRRIAWYRAMPGTDAAITEASVEAE
ncbi:MAG: hypothetical protein IT368_17555, partial [Candidatus Hydrogenedentes bacterium]|nr:hypothetical protein [Candidatus Hydrogenedentota bacterium]